VDVFFVERALKRGVGQDQIKSIFGPLFGFLAVGEIRTERILIVDIRSVDFVQHHIHGRDPQHGDIEIKAVKHLAFDMFPLLWLDQVRSISFFASLLINVNAIGRSKVFTDCLHELDKESARSTGGIADRPRHGFVIVAIENQIDHGTDHVAWRTELAVDPRRRQLAEQVLIEVPFGISLGQR